MYELKLTEHCGQIVADSRDVARAIGKEHRNLMRSINTYYKHLNHAKNGGVNQLKIERVKFFIPATYTDEKGEERPCYYLTRMGCDMVANKMTGERGTLFTAAYVTRFHEMEAELTKRRELRAEGKPQRRSLTDMIRDNPEANRWDYKLYTDLAYKAAFGKTAAQIRKERAPGSKRRAVDLLTADELTVYQKQENAVASLYAVGVDYEAMKAVLLTERTK